MKISSPMHALAFGAAAISGGIGVCVLAAWGLGRWQLTAMGADLIPVAPVSAVLFVVLGGALGVRLLCLEARGAEWVVASGAALAAMVGAAELARAVWGFSLPWEIWRFSIETHFGVMEVGRMAPLTAVGFLLAAVALAAQSPTLGRLRSARWLAHGTAALGALMAGLVVLAYAAGTPLGYDLRSVPMAALSALSFLILNVGLILAGRIRHPGRVGPDCRSATQSETATSPLFGRRVIVGLVVLAVVGGLIGFYHSRKYQTAVRELVHDELATIADLKVREITQWRRERIGDAQVLAATSGLPETIAQLAAGAPTGASTKNYLSTLQEVRGYGRIVLFDRAMAPVLTVPANPRWDRVLTPATRQAIGDTRVVIVEDLHRDGGGQIELDLLAPVRRDEVFAGAVLLTIEAEAQLDPLLAPWPAANESVETALVCRKGEWIVFLSKLRHQPDAALNFRLPLAHPTLVAAIALREGPSGLILGTDYRGVRVFGISRAVPETPWVVLATMDQAEAYAPVYREAQLLLLGYGLAAILVGLVARNWWHDQQRHHLQQRLAAEGAARAIAERLAIVMRHAKDVILVLDEGMRIVEANERAVEVYGYTPEEIHRLSVQDLRAPATIGSLSEEFARALDPAGLTFETTHRRKDGRPLAVEVSARPVEMGGRRYVLSIIRDISERKQAEVMLSSVLNSVPQAIFWKDRQCVYLGCNDVFARFAGLKNPEEIVGKTDFDLPWSRDASEQYRTDDQAVMQRREAKLHIIEQLQPAAGGRIWLDTSKLPLLDAAGHVYGVLGVFEDITERKRMTESLRESETRFRALSEHSLAGIYIVKDDRLTYVNPALAAIFGYRPEELIGVSPLDLIHPEDRGLVAENIRRRMTGEIHALRYEFRGMRQDGAVVNIEVMGARIELNGRPAIMGNILDITERRRAEDAVRASEERFRSLIEKAPVAVGIARAGLTLYANRKYRELFGYEPTADLVGQPISKQWAAEFRAEVVEWSRRRVLGLPAPSHYEGLGERKDGSQFPLEVYVSVVELPDGPASFAALTDITARKQAEEAVRASEDRFRTAFKTGMSANVIVGRDDGMIVEVNDRMVSLYGYTREEMIGRTSLELGMWAEPEVRQKLLAELKATGRVQNFEVLARRKGGETFWVLYSVSELKLEGKPLMLGVIHDITERKRAEDALKKSDERFQLSMEATSDGLWDWNKETDEVYYSPACYHMLGYEVGEFPGTLQGWQGLLHPDDKEHAMQANMDCVEGRCEAFAVEYRLKAKDGAWHWILGRGRSVARNPQGRSVRLVGTNLDITERKLAELRLREQAALLDQASDAIFVSNLDNRVTYWNRSAERLFGWRSQEALDRRPEDLFPEYPLAQVSEIRQVLLERGQWEGEIILRNRAGEPLNIDLRATLARGAAGQPYGRILICTDITEKKKIQEQFLRAQRLESVGMLAAGIAHDLNNVLAPVGMISELLRKQLPEERNARLFDTLNTCTQRGAGLIRQILGFAHGMGGEARLVQIKHLLRDIGQMVQETFPKSITLQEEIPTELWPIVCNPTQIHQVLLNLCVNARDAMPEGGTLTLRGENCRLDAGAVPSVPGAKPGDWLVLHVADTGTGMSPDTQTRIWDPFFTTKPAEKGTGLGLSTVRGIVEAHQGFATVDTAIGRGTTFRIYLPAAETDLATASAEKIAPPQSGHGEGILVVDDEEFIREVANETLSSAGYRVVTAADGAEAAARLATQAAEFSLVISDLEMPLLDGAGLARLIRARYPAMKILRISGIVGVGSPPRKDTENLADGFLAKPFTAAALLKIVDEMLMAKSAST